MSSTLLLELYELSLLREHQLDEGKITDLLKKTVVPIALALAVYGGGFKQATATEIVPAKPNHQMTAVEYDKDLSIKLSNRAEAYADVLRSLITKINRMSKSQYIDFVVGVDKWGSKHLKDEGYEGVKLDFESEARFEFARDDTKGAFKPHVLTNLKNQVRQSEDNALAFRKHKHDIFGGHDDISTSDKFAVALAYQKMMIDLMIDGLPSKKSFEDFDDDDNFDQVVIAYFISTDKQAAKQLKDVGF